MTGMKSLIRKNVREMDAYTPGEQPRVNGLIKLNTNENPYPPSPRVARVLRELLAERLRLYPDPVSLKLRQRIAAIHGCKISQVFAGNGSDEVLALCTRAFVEDDGSVGYFNPSYSLYPVLADIRNVKKKPVELGPEFEWRMPKGYDCSLFFMTFPNAPTGILYPREKVVEFCRKSRGVVLIDEAYVDFSRYNCMDLALRMKNVLVMRTLSKSFSLAGMRVGYVVGSKALIDALYKIKDSYNLDRVSQEVALAALSDMEHMRANVRRIVATRRRLSEGLKKLGFKVYPSDSNFIWTRPAGESALSFFERMRAKKILIRYFPGKRTGDCVRITIGTDREIMKLLREAGK